MLVAQPARVARRQSNAGNAAGRRVRDREERAADDRKALLPHRILDDDRHDVPATPASAQPRLDRGRPKEVGDDEYEAARLYVVASEQELVDRSLENVVGSVESGREPVLDLTDALPARR